MANCRHLRRVHCSAECRMLTVFSPQCGTKTKLKSLNISALEKKLTSENYCYLLLRSYFCGMRNPHPESWVRVPNGVANADSEEVCTRTSLKVSNQLNSLILLQTRFIFCYLLIGQKHSASIFEVFHCCFLLI